MVKALFAFEVTTICRLMSFATCYVRPINSVILQRNPLQFTSHHQSNNCEASYQELPILSKNTWRLLLWYELSNVWKYNIIYFTPKIKLLFQAAIGKIKTYILPFVEGESRGMSLLFLYPRL